MRLLRRRSKQHYGSSISQPRNHLVNTRRPGISMPAAGEVFVCLCVCVCVCVLVSSCDDEDVDNLSVDLGVGEQNVYCGSRRPPMLMSAGARLQLTLRTGPSSSTTRGFAVNFAFVTGCTLYIAFQFAPKLIEVHGHQYKNMSAGQ